MAQILERTLWLCAGAHRRVAEGKIGLFELAHHGTIFLDEISELDKPLQTYGCCRSGELCGWAPGR